MTQARRPSAQTLAVLNALAEDAAGAADGPEDAWSHGYDLCARLGIKAGTMYPILIRLAERGLVETSWERESPRGRPPRHLYRLSAAGREYAEQADRAAAPTPASAFAPRALPASGFEAVTT